MRIRGIGYLWRIACASFCAWLGLIPIQAWHFGTLNALTVPANVAAMPLVWLCTVGGGVLAVAGFLHSWISIPVAWIVRHLLISLGALVFWMADWPFAAMRMSRPGWPLLVGYYGVIFIFFAKKEYVEITFSRLTLRKIHVVLVLVLVVVLLNGFFGGVSTLKVYFLPLGSGDCILIQAPGSGTILVDGGTPDKAFSSSRGIRLLTALNALRVKRIDCLVLTHADSDHIGELKAVVESLPVRMFITNPVEDPTVIYAQLLQALQAHDILIRRVRAGDRVEGFPGLNIEVVSPSQTVLSQPKVEDNDASLVIRASYGEFDLLLTGDITQKVERLLLDELPVLESEVLKVPHHGSKYSSSSSFLRKVAPEVAVIQVGRNSYGHPHPDALARLEAVCDLVMRTDLDGTVEIESNGTAYWVRDCSSASP
ncbi:MAG TPA: ComEC/Rec2 family competence protein, partial [bacterium]|nr:ComEC/Rec2 family competence protein [bacterium]